MIPLHSLFADPQDESNLHENEVNKPSVVDPDQPLATWFHSLAGGPERFICALIAFFLFLSILFVQLYVHVLAHQHWAMVYMNLCPMLVTNYNPYDNGVTFECHVKMMFLAWIGSMLASGLVLVAYFVVWYCFTWPGTVRHTLRQSGKRVSSVM